MTVTAAGNLTPRAIAVIAVSAAALLAASSCTKEPTAGPSAIPTSSAAAGSAAPSTGVEEAQAREKVLTAYDGYRNAYVAAAAIPDTSGGKLRDFTADPLLGLLRADLQLNAEQGYVMTGRPTWTVKVVKVNVMQRPFTADTEECLDTTNWKVVKKSTGKSVAAPNQSFKYLVTGEAAQFDDGRWLIRRVQAHRDRPC